MIVKILNKRMTYYIYCDESGTTAHKYMVIGGICFNENNYEIIDNTINKFREDNNMKAEMKFIKISKQKENEYKGFINHIFNLINNGILQFRCIVIDKTSINEKKFKQIKCTYGCNNHNNIKDSECFFQKMYFLLLSSGFVKYLPSSKNLLYFYLDERNSKFDLQKIKKNLIYKNNKNEKQNSIKEVSYIDSKKSNFIQIVDILIGAINYTFNDKNKTQNKNNTKTIIQEYIKEKTGIEDFKQGTLPNEERFNIWLFRPKKNCSGR